MSTREDSYRQRYDLWREELGRVGLKTRSGAGAPQFMALASLQIEAVDSYTDSRRVIEIVKRAHKAPDAPEESGTLYYNSIKAELSFARNKDRLSVHLDDQAGPARSGGSRVRFEVYFMAAKYAQLFPAGQRLIVEVSKAFVIKEKPNEQVRIESFLFTKNPLNNINRWIFDLRFEPEAFELARASVRAVNEVLREIGLKVVEEEIPIKELTAKQEGEFAKYDDEVRKLSMQQKIKAVTMLPYPRLSKRPELGLRCPVYACFEQLASVDELRLHIAKHPELKQLQLKLTPEGCIQFPDELLHHVILFEHFFKEFIQKKVIQAGNARGK